MSNFSFSDSRFNFNAPFANLPSVHNSLTKVQYLNYKFSSSQIPFFRFLCQITCTVKCRCKVVERYHQMDLRFRVHFLHKMLIFFRKQWAQKEKYKSTRIVHYISPSLQRVKRRDDKCIEPFFENNLSRTSKYSTTPSFRAWSQASARCERLQAGACSPSRQSHTYVIAPAPCRPVAASTW